MRFNYLDDESHQVPPTRLAVDQAGAVCRSTEVIPVTQRTIFCDTCTLDDGVSSLTTPAAALFGDELELLFPRHVFRRFLSTLAFGVASPVPKFVADVTLAAARHIYISIHQLCIERTDKGWQRYTGLGDQKLRKASPCEPGALST